MLLYRFYNVIYRYVYRNEFLMHSKIEVYHNVIFSLSLELCILEYFVKFQRIDVYA